LSGLDVPSALVFLGKGCGLGLCAKLRSLPLAFGGLFPGEPSRKALAAHEATAAYPKARQFSTGDEASDVALRNAEAAGYVFNRKCPEFLHGSALS
jgi:hypothetical protein